MGESEVKIKNVSVVDEARGAVRRLVESGDNSQESYQAAHVLFDQLPTEKKNELGWEILSGWWTREDVDFETRGWLFDLSVDSVDLADDKAVAIGRILKARIEGDRGENYQLDLQRISTNEKSQKMLFRAAAVDGVKLENFNTMVRDFTDVEQLPRRINKLREMVDDGSLGEEEKFYYEGILRSWLGIEAGKPLHTSLESVYRAIDFREYKVNKASQQERLEQVESLWKKYGIKKWSKVVDVACGTGWFVNEMAKKGYEQIFGIDVSEKNIELAETDFGKERFARAAWNEQPFEDGELDGETCLGRSLPHGEDRVGFVSFLRESFRVVKKGGLIIIDMPNPKKGSCARNQEYFKGLVKRVGYTDSELKNFSFTVDAPDAAERSKARNLYNRYTPAEEDIIGEVEYWGGRVLEVIKTEIPNGTGEDENMVFVIENTKESPWSRLFEQLPGESEPRLESSGNGDIVDDNAE